LIRAERLSRAFGNLQAVKAAGFHVPEGSVTGFVGPNGAGKTTVLRMICGLLRPTSGRVLVNGLDPVREPLEVRRRLSYLPGETSIYLHMRGREFLEFLASFRDGRDGELERRLPRLFELPLERKVRTYSAGMKQKLALCGVLSAPVPLLLLDEPTRGLDATMRAQFNDAVELLRERGRTIFVSSHHLADIEKVCDRMIFLLEGEVVPTGRVEALRRDLASLVRVRLREGFSPGDLPLPPGTAWESRGGWVRIRAGGDPRELVASLAHGPVEALLWGRAELEEIYRHLYLEKSEKGGEG